MKPRVFITRDISKLTGETWQLVKKECELEVSPHNGTMPKNELIEKVRDKEGILVLATDSIDKAVIDAGRNLRVIATWSQGTNHIDIEAATSRGIFVTNTPSEDLATAVAEAAWGLLLAVTRQIVIGDRDVRSGLFSGWGPLDYIGPQISGKTLGIVGLGKIGKAVAQRALGWNLRLLYTDVVAADSELEKTLNLERVSLETLLKESDFITLHVPLILRKTYHLIGERELRLMKPSAYLVNTSRGAVIDEKALVTFLSKKRIAGAALDVYENEPLLTEGLAKLDNVVLTPHLAGASLLARTSAPVLAIKNLLAGAKGEVPPNVVNRELIRD